MYSFFLRFLVTYLSVFLIVTPAWAGSQKSVALVEVFESRPNPEFTQVSKQIETFLNRSKKVRLISQEKVASYFYKNQVLEGAMVEGDRLYDEAEDFFYAFLFNKALEVLERAEASFRKQPGTLEGLFKVQLLKAEINLSEGKTEEATSAVNKAISYDTSRQDLNSYSYPPKIRQFYQTLYRQYLRDHSLASLKIQVRGNKKVPIYINGVYRGDGPELEVKIPQYTPQMVTAGNGLKASVTAVTAGSPNFNGKALVSAKGETDGEENAQTVGFKQSSLTSLTAKSVALGQALGADEVVLVKLSSGLGRGGQLSLRAIDPLTNQVGDEKRFALANLPEDLIEAGRDGANYIEKPSWKGLASVEKVEEESPQFQAELTKVKKEKKVGKKGFPKGILYALIGVVVVGAGVGVALGMGGGSGPGPSTTTSTSISGPAPETP